MKDGIIIAAAQEERFTRKKHDYFYQNIVWNIFKLGEMNSFSFNNVILLIYNNNDY